MRSELTATQQAEHLAKRKELWAMREIQVAQLDPPEIGYKKPPAQVRGFAADTADATGASKATINRATARAEQISEDARAEMRLTEEYDAAQDRGEVKTQRDNQLVDGHNKLSPQDIGLRRDEIHDARKLPKPQRQLGHPRQQTVIVVNLEVSRQVPTGTATYGAPRCGT